MCAIWGSGPEEGARWPKGGHALHIELAYNLPLFYGAVEFPS